MQKCAGYTSAENFHLRAICHDFYLYLQYDVLVDVIFLVESFDSQEVQQQDPTYALETFFRLANNK